MRHPSRCERFSGKLGIWLIGISACTAIWTQPALGARGHEYAKTFGWGVLNGSAELQSCSATCKEGIAGSGEGQLSKEVAGMAVEESTHELYLADSANHRVEVFGAKEEFLRELKGPFTTATGTGALTSGSATIKSVVSATGAFGPGQEISAPGLPAGTTIVAVNGEKGELEVSQPASASESASLTTRQSLLEPKAVAIDNSCVQLKLSEPQCKAQDPSNGDIYVQDAGPGHQVIDKFSASGAFLNQVERSPETKSASNLLLTGIAVDEHGGLWVSETAGLEVHHGVDDYSNAEANVWSEFQTIRPPADQALGGLAVDSKDNLYIRTNQNEGTVVEFNAKGELLNGELDSEFPAVSGYGLASEAKTDDVYINNIGSLGRFAPPVEGRAAEVERLGAGHLSAANPENYQSGVAVDAASGTVYVADSAASDIVVFSLEVPKPPTIESESVSEVTADSASLQAEINPRGAPSEYHFEYGPCSSPTTCAASPYETQVPGVGEAEEVVGGALDFEGHPVSTQPQDLKAATTYHFRVVVHNEKNKAGEVLSGEEKVFTTQPEASFELPDGRAWEMVSPPQKHGTLIRPILEGVIEAAASGNALAYITDSPTEDEPQGYSNFVSVLAVRQAKSTPARAKVGWYSQDIALPHEVATGQSVGQGQEYHLFSDDLARAVVQPFGAFDPAISEEASEQTPYLRSDFIGENAEEPCSSGCLRPLVRSAPHPFGEEGQCPPHAVCGPLIAGASADARHVVVEASVGLSETPGDNGGLYEWSEGEGSLQLVSALPKSGKPAEDAKLGAPDLLARQAVSAEGTRVVFTAQVAGKAHLYMRETDSEETVQLDEGLSGTPEYQTASADDSRVFFTENGDVYLYEAESGKAKALTSGAEVQGLMIGASEDGRYVYFTGNGALAGGSVQGSCGKAAAVIAQCNLYELAEAGGEWSIHLVAVLSGEDLPDFSPKLARLTARVSPDGQYLAFMSQRSLSGYDNRDAHSAKRDEEVYEFDAQSGRVRGRSGWNSRRSREGWWPAKGAGARARGLRQTSRAGPPTTRVCPSTNPATSQTQGGCSSTPTTRWSPRT
jgi:DNA-binding beta-propeller fold protein YncE